jgi:nucleoside-diphosphate-sugar epimerase
VFVFYKKSKKKNDSRFFKFNFKNIDRVYFLAWDVGGSKYLFNENNQLSQLKWNIDLLKNTLNQLEEQKKDFLFVSSQFADDGDTVYGVTKRLGEIWTSLIGGKCVRVWNAYGVMEKNNEKSHVISDFVYQAVKTKKINMMTNGEEWRQFTHVQDLSRAFHMAMNDKVSNKTLFDASSYEWVQVKQIADIISQFTGAKVILGSKVGKNHRAFNMGRIPNWLPQVSLKEGIKDMINEAK